jgi:hypothetical protein
MADKTRARILIGVLFATLAVALSAVAILVITDVAHTQHCMDQTYTTYLDCMEE